MIANGWRLFVHPLLDHQLQWLEQQVEALAAQDPRNYLQHGATKLLATMRRYMVEIIPRDPNASAFRQGNTLGAYNRHWFRAKFHERYRLFYRFSSKEKIIVYAWVNDERTLRKAGAKSDPYSVFKAMLVAGDPPADMDRLLHRARELQG